MRARDIYNTSFIRWCHPISMKRSFLQSLGPSGGFGGDGLAQPIVGLAQPIVDCIYGRVYHGATAGHRDGPAKTPNKRSDWQTDGRQN